MQAEKKMYFSMTLKKELILPFKICDICVMFIYILYHQKQNIFTLLNQTVLVFKQDNMLLLHVKHRLLR